MDQVDRLSRSAQDAFDRVSNYCKDKPATSAAIAVAAISVGCAAWSILPSRASQKKYRRKPGTFELSGGNIDSKEIRQEFEGYSKSYGTEAGAGITDRSNTSELVDKFYSLVTDIYEWGWGQSFHFSPLLPGKSIRESEAAHEARLAAIIGLRPGKNVLDVGCGVGGPMRTIASTSGGVVTGITINDYQVSRAEMHNQNLGLESLCKPTQGDFLHMPFGDCTFDGAYAIEATCHAAKLSEVYSEIYRVLKPGAIFASYEWVSTAEYNPKNKDHVRIIDEINFGNGLPEMRTYKEAEEAGAEAGFDKLESIDLATASPVAGPWYGRLKRSRFQHHINQAIVSTTSFLHLCPAGVKEVHHMLVNVAHSLVQGGEHGVFSPMHLLVFKKPLENGSSSAKAATSSAQKTVDKASDSTAQASRKAADGAKQTGEKASANAQKAGDKASAGAQKAGENLSQTAQKAGQNISETAQKAGDKAAHFVKATEMPARPQ